MKMKHVGLYLLSEVEAKRNPEEDFACHLEQLGFLPGHWHCDERQQVHLRWASRDFSLGPREALQHLTIQELATCIDQIFQEQLLAQQEALGALVQEGLENSQQATASLLQIADLFQLPRDALGLDQLYKKRLVPLP